MKRKRLVIFFGVLVALFFIVYLTKDKSERVAAKPENDLAKDIYPVVNPVVMDTSYTVDYVADIQAQRYVELRSRVGGYVEKIYVDEGQHVKKGQLLFSISSKEYEADVIQANSMLNSAIADAKAAEVELRNTKDLVSKNVVSQTQLDIAQSKVDALNAKIEEARSEEENARLNLSYTRITAPFDGVIGRIPNKVGSLVQESTLLSTISDNSKVYAYFNVSESDYLDLINSLDKTQAERSTGKHDSISEKSNQDPDHRFDGQEVYLVLANQELYPYAGKIESIDNNINPETGNITFRASFPNPGQLLQQGATATVRVKKEVPNAILVPQKSTFDVQDKIYVFAVDKNNQVYRKAIVPVISLPNLYILNSGLTSSDRIIYEGIQDVHDGDKVNVESVSFLPPKSGEQLALMDGK